MRHTEFWTRMDEAMGRRSARAWAAFFVIGDLGGRTVEEALAAGVPPKQVWSAVWRTLQLPESLR